ncbi:hypothetical protein KC19_11G164400 [Ceratodon purpureus]|uniref:Secreted protein n=1 Tax=Ceratodon purpureus TaxID=3225 RepID=A0A8T0GH68_CERPU|nr:hypothetical protein KC19_11G164400 [Ceratodon purpureus]
MIVFPLSFSFFSLCLPSISTILSFRTHTSLPPCFLHGSKHSLFLPSFMLVRASHENKKDKRTHYSMLQRCC